VEVFPDGEVVQRQRVWGQFSQPLDLTDFPFDEHTFSIQVVATGYRPEEIAFLQDPERKSGIAEQLSVADWQIVEWTAKPGFYQPVPDGERSAGLVFSFRAVRDGRYYVLKVLVPLFSIVAMSWVVFWIDPKESGIQIGVATTAMLTLVAFRFAIGTYLPRIGHMTRMDSFVLGANITVFACLVEVVVTSFLAHTDRLVLARRMDRVMRVAFPAVFAVLAYLSLIK